jgi:hypothetical protein
MRFLRPKKQSEDGESMATAIVIKAPNSQIGVAKEYEWVAKHYGRPRVDWNLVSQALLDEDGRYYDLLHIRLADGTEKQFYFDITDFFGKH